MVEANGAALTYRIRLKSGILNCYKMPMDADSITAAAFSAFLKCPTKRIFW